MNAITFTNIHAIKKSKKEIIKNQLPKNEVSLSEARWPKVSRFLVSVGGMVGCFRFICV
jgi:hypothetical protein